MKKTITKKEKFAYAFAAAASYMTSGITESYLMIFFTDIALLTPGFVMALMLVARAWDIVNDPLMGLAVDKTTSKYGKMRPHIFIGSFVILTFAVLLFVPIGGLSMTGRMVYAVFAYVGYGMAYTYVDVPALGLMSASTPDSDERASLLSFYVTVGSVAGLLPIGLLPVLSEFIPKKWVYFALSSLAGLLAFVGYQLLFRHGKERFTTKTQKYKLSEIARTAVKNKPMILTFLMSMIACPRHMILPAIAYIATYVVFFGGVSEMWGLLILYFILGGGLFMGIFLTPSVYKRFGYKAAAIGAALVGGIFFSLAFFVYKINVYAALPLLTIGAMGAGAYNVLPHPMVGDSLDYLELRTGERMEGMCFSLDSFVTKFNAAIGYVGLSVCLIAFKYVNPTVPGESVIQSQFTKDGLFSILSLIPGIGFFLSVIPMLFYDITKKRQEEIRAALAERRILDEMP